jgi:hypothetical protein
MSRLSYRLSKAVSDGRTARGRPTSREEVLSRLLMKRAMAHRAGLHQLEASLRGQITWALPVRNGEEDARLADDAPALDDRL